MAEGCSSRMIEIAGRIVHRTKSGILFDDGTREVWLPRSQVTWNEDDGLMDMPEWLAIEKELV